jgi:pimeloyl-ACP methyl ester carboxylesterase
MAPYHALLVAAASLLAMPAPAQEGARMSLEPCRLEHPYGLGSVEARCGRFPVAEDPDDPAGRRIELAVAVIPAVAARALPDPLFLLAGGPGQGARESFVGLLGALSGVRRERDIVLLDQRGTGDSNRMQCDFPAEALETGGTPEQLQELARACLATLPGDPRFYTTSVAVRDLDAVRAALGYERINLYGASYGTRVAQHYLRRYPDRVRSVILDGVVYPAMTLGPALALDAENALQSVFERCEAAPSCAARYPDLRRDFDALRARLDASPARLRIPDPSTAEPREVEFGGEQLALATRMLVYSDATAALLPLFIHQAQASGNLAPLAAQAEMIHDQLEDAMAIGMHNSVACSEDLPFVDLQEVDRAALARSFLGEDMIDTLAAICATWPRGPVDEDLKAPLASAVPALLLSGEFDPVTPPAYAARAATGFSDHASLVFRGQGHVQLGSRCAQAIIREFLEAGTAAGLDTACVDEVRPMPFFLDFNGGSP